MRKKADNPKRNACSIAETPPAAAAAAPPRCTEEKHRDGDGAGKEWEGTGARVWVGRVAGLFSVQDPSSNLSAPALKVNNLEEAIRNFFVDVSVKMSEIDDIDLTIWGYQILGPGLQAFVLDERDDTLMDDDDDDDSGKVLGQKTSKRRREKGGNSGGEEVDAESAGSDASSSSGSDSEDACDESSDAEDEISVGDSSSGCDGACSSDDDDEDYDGSHAESHDSDDCSESASTGSSSAACGSESDSPFPDVPSNSLTGNKSRGGKNMKKTFSSHGAQKRHQISKRDATTRKFESDRTKRPTGAQRLSKKPPKKSAKDASKGALKAPARKRSVKLDNMGTTSHASKKRKMGADGDDVTCASQGIRSDDENASTIKSSQEDGACSEEGGLHVEKETLNDSGSDEDCVHAAGSECHEKEDGDEDEEEDEEEEEEQDEDNEGEKEQEENGGEDDDDDEDEEEEEEDAGEEDDAGEGCGNAGQDDSSRQVSGDDEDDVDSAESQNLIRQVSSLAG